MYIIFTNITYNIVLYETQSQISITKALHTMLTCCGDLHKIQKSANIKNSVIFFHEGQKTVKKKYFFARLFVFYHQDFFLAVYIVYTLYIWEIEKQHSNLRDGKFFHFHNFVQLSSIFPRLFSIWTRKFLLLLWKSTSTTAGILKF